MSLFQQALPYMNRNTGVWSTGGYPANPGGVFYPYPTTQPTMGGTSTAVANPYDPSGSFSNYMAALAQQLQGESAADKASATAAIRRALISGGFEFNQKDVAKQTGYKIPNSFGYKTALAIQNANKAGLTQSFKINQANTDANRQIINNLAARGILRSGDTGYTLGRQNTAFTQAQYGARQHILDVISGIWAGYLAAERQRQAMLAQAGMGGGG